MLDVLPRIELFHKTIISDSTRLENVLLYICNNIMYA